MLFIGVYSDDWCDLMSELPITFDEADGYDDYRKFEDLHSYLQFNLVTDEYSFHRA